MKLFTIDARSLAAFRIAISLVLLLYGHQLKLFGLFDREQRVSKAAAAG